MVAMISALLQVEAPVSIDDQLLVTADRYFNDGVLNNNKNSSDKDQSLEMISSGFITYRG